MNGSLRWLIGNLITLVKSCTAWAPAIQSASADSSHIREDIDLLERRLLSIQEVLHDAEQREVEEASVRLWLDELQQLAYDAEDVLDVLQYEILREQVANRTAVAASRLKRKGEDDADNDDDHDDHRSHSSPSSHSASSVPDDIGERIKKIFDRFEEIAEGRERLRLRPEEGQRLPDFSMNMNVPPESSSVDSSVIIGRDEDKQRLIDLVLAEDGQSEGNVSVIPIVGMGGIGKTTLARMVYNDPQVCMNFSIRGWVHVGDDFDVVRLTQAITSTITGGNSKDEELDQMQGILTAQLRDKKFLFVLDDVWNERLSLWRSLRAPLFGVGKGKIIVTTRSERVAKIMHRGVPYKLDCLSPEDGWHLFERYAYDWQDTDHQEDLVEIGKQIVQKCGGLPLALKVLGGMLYKETAEERWMDVLQSELSELDEMSNTYSILPALRLSYSRLPAPLKPCFLYCSLFPKDWNFQADNLVGQWMAHGYLSASGHRAVEDIGNYFINELQRRSFFDSGKNGFGQVGLSMHDMIHELARSILGNQQLLIRSDADQHLIIRSDSNNQAHNSLKTIRHLFVRCRTTAIKTFAPFSRIENLRTLIADDSNFLPYVCQHSTIGKDKLRVLALANMTLFSNGSIQELPEFIGNLRQLRFLDLFCHSLKRLPHSICNLYNLQHLRIFGSDEIEELPADFGNLINLRYLNLYLPSITRLPESAKYLCKLQTLILDSPMIRDFPVGLRNLTSLRCLQLCVNKTIRLDGIINTLSNLQIVHLPRNACWPKGIGEIHGLKMLSPNFSVGRHGSHCAALSELKDLVNIGPELKIVGLKNVISAKESISTNLHSKRHLTEIELVWCQGNCMHGNSGVTLNLGNEVMEQLNEEVLESLYPHRNIRELIIDGFGGAKFSKWLSEPLYSNLVDLKLYRCENCQILPPLGQLPSLKELILSSMSSIKSIGDEFCHRLDTRYDKAAFPSLVKLTLRYFPELICWQCNELNGNFPVLRSLSLTECPKLEAIPTNKSLTELRILRLDKIRPDAISCKSFPNLIRLELFNCESFSTLQPLGQLLYLRELNISNLTIREVGKEACDSMFSNPDDAPRIQFPSLVMLVIAEMSEWEEWYSDSSNGNFPVLSELLLTRCPKLKMNPRVNSLKKLSILGLKSLRSLSCPDYLKLLVIHNCPNLNSVEGLVYPVDELSGSRCPEYDLGKIPAINSRVEF